MKVYHCWSARLAILMGILLLVACSGGGERGVSSQAPSATVNFSNVRGLEREPLAVSYTLPDSHRKAGEAAKFSKPFGATNDVLMALEKASPSDLSDAYEIVYARPKE